MEVLTDIRPGNKVLHNASGTTVTVLKINNDIIELECFPESIQCAVTDISGIELTNNLLQQLSFSDEQERDKWSGQGINIEKKPDGFYYGLRINRNRSKMQHLHQLQNYIHDFYTLFRQLHYTLNISALD